LVIAGIAALLLVDAGIAAAGHVDIVYSGGQRGITRASSRFELQERLRPQLEAAGITVDRVDVLHGVMAQGPYEVWPVDGSVTSALKYAAGTPICDEGVLVETARTPTERFLPRPGSPEIEVRDAWREPRWLQRCEADGVWVVALSPPMDPGAEMLKLDAFDLRTGFRWVAGEHQWYQLGHPRREAGRRLGTIREALEARPGALFADAGDFVDRQGHPDDPIWEDAVTAGFEVLAALHPTALAAGGRELQGGVAALVARAERLGLPYVTTNWQMADGSHPFPAHRSVEVELDDGPGRIVFLGVTDPRVAEDVPAIAAAGLTLMDPVDAVNAEVDALRTSADPPDLIVLLANASPELQRRLRGRLRGVDLFLGDPTMATFRVDRSRTVFRGVGAAFKAAPITLPLDGIAAARVEFGPDGPTSVDVQPLEVRVDAPTDEALTRVTTDLAVRALTGHEGALIPAADPLVGVTPQRWRKVVCESVAGLLDADAVFLDGLPEYRSTPGALTEPQVRDRLRGGHVLEVHRVDGDRLVKFLQAAHNTVPIHCGAPTNTAFPQVRGRFVDAQRTYRVVTTHLSRTRGRLGDLLAIASSGLVGHQPKFRVVPDGDGVLTLDRAVMRALRQERDGDGVAALEERKASDRDLQVLIRLRRASFRLVRFEGSKNDAYAAVPETALNSPSSFTLGGEADVAIEVGSRFFRADLRFQAAYTRFAIDEIPIQETVDDWVISSTLDLPVASLPPKAAMQIHPFVQISFDSEFTPNEGPDGAPGLRQSDLSFFGGIATKRGSWLREFRLGPFVNRDLARLEDKDAEAGGRWTGATRHNFLPLSALRLTTAWDLQVFGDTELDDASDLRLRLAGEVRLQVRVVRSLSLALFAQGLLVQGRVESTRTPTGTVTLGVALDLTSVFRLDATPRLFP
jgi:hypothetical protein